MGVYARTDLERGIFKAPAGNDALVEGALAVSANFTDAQHTDMVRNGWVNGIRNTAGLGIIVAASRTLSTDTRWWYVNVRLLFNFVKSTLRDGLRFVRQEPNSDTLRRSVRLNVVTPFLLGLWKQGAFGSIRRLRYSASSATRRTIPQARWTSAISVWRSISIR